MAESVGFHVERMIPELEQMKRLKLFKPEEIAEIIKKRKEFEYKTERPKKEKQDFLSYIYYEVKLIRETKLRRDKYRISEKKDEIEYAITKRIIKLYKMALSYFKSDVQLWMNYIIFCIQTRFLNAVSEAFKQMLQVHGDKIYLWKHAAKFELEEMNNIDGALNVLKTGLHHHPDSKELYTEAFRLELLSGAQAHKNVPANEDEVSRQEKTVRRAEVHFNTSVKTIGNDVEFIIALLDIATSYDYTESLQKLIVEYLTTNCWRCEQMWHTMAQRELNGHHYDKNTGNSSRIQLCVSVYKSAVEVVPTSTMWEKYLDTLSDLYMGKAKRKNSVKEILLQALQEACDAGVLLEKHYLVWIEIVEPVQKLEILVKATAALPQSVQLWIKRLQYHTSRDENQDAEVRVVSREAINSLKTKSLPIYKFLIQYYSLIHENYTLVKDLYDEGIKQDIEISLELRPMYIEWLCLTRSIKFARQEYERISHLTPYCLELHKKMIQLELGRVGTPNLNAIRNIFKMSCQQFGDEQSDVWIDYIKFEMNSGDARLVSHIYDNAKNALNENLVSTFSAEFALLNTY